MKDDSEFLGLRQKWWKVPIGVQLETLSGRAWRVVIRTEGNEPKWGEVNISIGYKTRQKQ